MTTTDGWLTFFAELSSCYRILELEPTWGRRFGGHREDPWRSLGLFLHGYGFGGRAGGGYDAGVGAKALSLAREHGPFADALAAAETTWELLLAISRQETASPRRHPLYPSSDPDGLDVRSRPSLLEVRYFGDVTAHRAPLTDFASTLLARDDLSTVLDLLTEVRGIGGTRAGWFLRDLAVWYDGTAPSAYHTVEPVDDHVGQCVTLLATGSGDGSGDGTDAGTWLLDRCGAHGLQPHRVSAGMTYFATRVAGDPYRLEQCLTDLGRTRRLVREHLERLERVAADEGRGESRDD